MNQYSLQFKGLSLEAQIEEAPTGFRATVTAPTAELLSQRDTMIDFVCSAVGKGTLIAMLLPTALKMLVPTEPPAKPFVRSLHGASITIGPDVTAVTLSGLTAADIKARLLTHEVPK